MRGVKWIGRPAGSSGSWDDDGRYKVRRDGGREFQTVVAACNAETASNDII